MLAKKDRNSVNQVEIISIEELVPEDHLLRAVEESIDFNFIYDEVKLIKLLLLQSLYGYPVYAPDH